MRNCSAWRLSTFLSQPSSFAILVRKKRQSPGMSSALSRRAGRWILMTLRRWKRSMRNVPSWTIFSRFLLVAAMILTLTLTDWWPPTR